MGGIRGANRPQGRTHFLVSVVSMETLIRSIPPNIDILHLKTDMQGFDFLAVKSAGKALCRIPTLVTELYVNGHAPYEGVENDLELQWKPYMAKMGYNLTNAKGIKWVSGNRNYFAKEL